MAFDFLILPNNLLRIFVLQVGYGFGVWLQSHFIISLGLHWGFSLK